MEMLLFLIAFPLVAALLLVVLRFDGARGFVVVASAAAIAVASVLLVVFNAGYEQGRMFEFASPLVDTLCTAIRAVASWSCWPSR